MAFTKGKNKTGGRKKGTPNVITRDLREVVRELVEGNAERIRQDLEALDPKERVNAWLKLTEFVLPKLRRVETTYDLSNLAPEEIDRLFDRATAQTNGTAWKGN